jgi:hypothetical protein
LLRDSSGETVFFGVYFGARAGRADLADVTAWRATGYNGTADEKTKPRETAL